MHINVESLNNLGDERFETLIKSLLISKIGYGVTPFSIGKDGAREATYFGKANYPSDAEQWEGQWIFQVKFSDISLGIKSARNRIKSYINTELKKLEDYEYFKLNKCDNYIFITNVPFSGQAKVGLHDYINEKKSKYKLSNFSYWDGEKITHLINVDQQIRSTYFPLKGFNYIDKNQHTKISEVFVPPKEFNQLKKMLLNIQNETIIFKHPSFRKTIYDYYSNKHVVFITNFIVNTLKDEILNCPLQMQLVQPFKDVIQFIKINDLIVLLHSHIYKNLLPLIWSSIIKIDKSICLTEYIKMKRQKSIKFNFSKMNLALFKAREYLKKEEIFAFVCYLLSIRKSIKYKIVDILIYQYSYALRNKINGFIRDLNENNKRDLYLIINLYSCLIYSEPDHAFKELLRLSDHKYRGIRYKVYHIMNSFSLKYLITKEDEFIKILIKETDDRNKYYLTRVVQRIKKGSNSTHLSNIHSTPIIHNIKLTKAEYPTLHKK